MAAHGRLDILFNNAGVSFPAKVEDTTVEIWCIASALSIQSGQHCDTNKGTAVSLRLFAGLFALFASNPCFDPTSKKVITQITQRAANNANSQTLSAVTARISQIEDDPTHLQARAAKSSGEKTQVHACRRK